MRRCDIYTIDDHSVDPLLPTRVLNVSLLDSSADLKLVNGEGKRGRYAALTYCWGPNPDNTFKTASEVLAKRMERITIDELNPLFQDAVNVCRSLIIPYLGVDAICIVQNDRSDWLKESKRMCDVYSNALVTLSATLANSPDERLYYPEQDWSQSPAMKAVGAQAIPYFRGGDFSLQPSRKEDLPSKSPGSRGPLSGRGWCLQERYLSHRIIHLAESCEWECLTTTQMETRDSSIPYEIYRYQPDERPRGFESKQDLGLDQEAGALAKYPYNIWYLLLTNYTARNMTYDGDLLPGILGLADLFTRLTGDHLVCGLWSSNLVCGLMWEWSNSFRAPKARVLSGHSLEGRRQSQLVAHRTPSWSWINTVGPKEWAHEHLSCSEQDITVEEITAYGNETVILGIRTLVVPLPIRSPTEFELLSPWMRFTLDVPEPVEHKYDGGTYVTRDRLFEGEVLLLQFLKPQQIPEGEHNFECEGWGILAMGTDRADQYVRIGAVKFARLDWTLVRYCSASKIDRFEDIWRKSEVRTVYLA